ncbi:hypothetical protein K8Z61_13040 [Nocardioides sp. TRM66260-LWL]|uniref:hypothetical protein n=1 Tax=Nocardioides sp. TRM66260-LWL TaxID=2874478 RepID=UPI001CC79893|nr:hypothetical protein [Nocardioides sp. TRM66260-LWL]MBZ5735424.1 hypothetical protein [Nocardioides sp. TRM66260-LWL]
MSDAQPSVDPASRIANLAEDPRFAGRADDLRSLARDLADSDAEAWAGVDLFAAFPLGATARLESKNWVERALSLLTGITVFLPVGWTWLAFRDASAAYRDLLNAGKVEDGTTFLELWATGFQGTLTGRHLLVPTAMTSALLIFLAIATLVAHRIAVGVNVRREDAARESAQNALISGLTQAAVVLNARRADHPQRIEDILKQSVDRLASAHRAVKKTLNEVERTTAGVSVGMTTLAGTLTGTSDQVKELMVVATRTAEAAGSAADQAREASIQGTAAVVRAAEESQAAFTTVVQNGVAELNAAQTDATRHLADRVEATVASVGDLITTGAAQISATSASAGADITRSVSAAEQSFASATTDSIRRATEELNAVISRISSSAQETSSAAVLLAGEVEKISSSQERAQGELSAAVDEITRAIERLDSALMRQEGVLQGQVSELSAARDAAERMLLRLSSMPQPVGER